VVGEFNQYGAVLLAMMDSVQDKVPKNAFQGCFVSLERKPRLEKGAQINVDN
jgi:hypothetical protein